MIARLVCPRRLVPRTIYRALLVPTFARGAAVGLGAPATGAASDAAWPDPAAGGSSDDTIELPVYYEWRFGTGDSADFEQLARRLQPRALGATVGTRAMDVSAPGVGLPPASPSPIQLPGALVPVGTSLTPPPDDADPFVSQLVELLNEPAMLLESGGDPIVAPPLYGRWYGAVDRYSATAPAWLRELNEDLRWRVAAGLGTQVVQKNARALLAGAWARSPQLKFTNEALRSALLARMGANRLFARHVTATSALGEPSSERLLQLVSGALARVRSGSLTIRATLRNTAVGEDVFDRAWRVLSRPRSPLAQRQQRGTTTFESIASRINRGAVLAAFPPDVPTGTGTTVAVGALLAQTSPRGAFMSDYAKISDSVPLSPMTLLVASLLPPAGTALYELGWWKQLRSDASAGIPPKDTAATSKILDEMPSWSTFNPIEYTGKNAIAPTTNGKGSQQLAFRDAASALVTGLGMRPGTTKRLPAANLAELRDAVLAALDPDSTIPAGALARVGVSPNLAWAPEDPIEPLLVRPSYEQPMYEPLRDLGQEWLLPGLGDVPTDTIALVETNQAFVEAYMIGLNQEINRELLWNEYSTDQRHTFFRQFWDQAGFAVPVSTTIDPDELRDIKRIDQWSSAASLGSNSSRGSLDAQIVVLVRSELLRRYPNALVYAAQADPSAGPVSESRELHPVFSGVLPPDVTFLGFPLTLEELRTVSPEGLVWYFVIQEQPSEPRFGLDLDGGSSAPSSWDDLAWTDLPPDTNYIDLTQTLARTFPASPSWAWSPTSGSPTDAAQLAWITCQKPVRFAVPAAQMLEGL